MGVGTSKTNSSELIPLNKSEFKPVFDIENGNIKQMRQQLQNLIRYHSENYQTLLYLKTVNVSCPQNMTASALLDMTKKDKNLASKEPKIKYLYDIGAIFFDTNASHCSLKTYAGFDSIYSSFIDNLKYLETVDVNSFQLHNKTNAEVSSFNLDIQNHIKFITTRIIYYSFSIAYNNFLMSVYVMYAKKQFSVIDKKFRKIQHENQLRIVREKLNLQMKQVKDTLNKINSEDSSNQLNSRITELSAIFQKTENDAMKTIALKQRGGSSITPTLDALNQLHSRKIKEYAQSNKTFQTFLTMINSIIKEKTNRMMTKYLNSDVNTSIVTPELKNNINDIVSKIQSLDSKNSMGIYERNVDAALIRNVIAKSNIVADEVTKNELAKHDAIIRDLLDFKEIHTNTSALQTQLLNDKYLILQNPVQ